jgi:hypothetical protein
VLAVSCRAVAARRAARNCSHRQLLPPRAAGKSVASAELLFFGILRRSDQNEVTALKGLCRYPAILDEMLRLRSFGEERASGEKVDHFAHAKHLRGRAEEFRRVAQNITEEHTRNSFLELARSYDALANEEEALAMVDEKIRAALIFNT